MARLHLTRTNPTVSVQDHGRTGAMRYGVSQAGPMDWVRHAHALKLVGGKGTAAFEVGLGGAAFRAEGPVRIAVTGPGFSVSLGDGQTFAPPLALTLEDGATLTLQPGKFGMWAYVAVAGIDFGEPVLGSFATNVRTGMGRRDATDFTCKDADPLPPSLYDDVYDQNGPIAILRGPQHHLFDASVHDLFATASYALSDAVDRMGYRLSGPELKARDGHDIISDGIVEGAIQVPGNGQPIVLCADRQPTGGYPKIAVVARAARPRLIQKRPGDSVTFSWIETKDARRRVKVLQDKIAHPTPRIRAEFTPEYLFERNLVGGVWDPKPSTPDG